MAVVLLIVGFAAVLAGALLFTNAVEWAGSRLGLGVGAVGTLLAGVSTALPESAIPIVALIRDDPAADEVAIGAIVGAPFMLATVALALVGITALAYRRRREHGTSLDTHRPTVRRDLLVFVAAFGAAMVLGLGVPRATLLIAAVALAVGYVAYVVATVRRGGAVQAEDEIEPLTVDPTKHNPPTGLAIGLQLVGGLACIVLGAHLVVGELIAIAEALDVSPLVLALLIAPLATELPEKTNSFLWIRDGKDALALGNITGAMVFQATIPVAIGLGFTTWRLDRFALLAGSIAVAGGLVAYWSLSRRRRFAVPAIAAWLGLFATFAAGAWLLQ